ncbi:polysaccharide deacetylase family protein [Winogradskyella aquimaris]|uniref:Polysaccharide deacetylase family protein n=1 Tax=Winogradskyella aquimaris TaxID=864074 RepID=A0ABU5EM03_9FLAO|nr:polysaccharide deacetylase family protein [Winogradskyella aquimaris]MDY2587081.1 polysaccharide deacetylase family protein [Winogradskyella aquimaris]
MSLKSKIYKGFKNFANSKASRNSDFGSRIFIYHNVGDGQVDAFEKQMVILKSEFDGFVNVTEFVKLVQDGLLNSKKIACITFDDGFYDVYKNAKPILDKLNISATIFLNQMLYELTNEHPEKLEGFVNDKFPRLSRSHQNLRGLTAVQLKEFIEDDYEIGGHTYSHVSVSKIKGSLFEQEITNQRQFLKDNFGYVIKSFAYPYGRKKDIPSWGAKILKNCGYTSGFTGISQDISKFERINQFEFPRTSVSLNISEQEFRNLIKGSADILDKLTRQYK